MNARQKRFVDEYIVCGNAAESARRAGYSAKNADVIGAQNLVKLRKEIEARLLEIESERTLTVKEAQEHLAAVVRDELTEEVVTASGKKVRAKLREADKLKAIDLYFKASGAYKEKLEVKMDAGSELMAALARIENGT